MKILSVFAVDFGRVVTFCSKTTIEKPCQCLFWKKNYLFEHEFFEIYKTPATFLENS
jgi:hypothetical protein